LFDESNKVDQVIDFGAATDSEACDAASKLHSDYGYGVVELWGSNGRIYRSAPLPQRVVNATL
jgi:hypothetical protein